MKEGRLLLPLYIAVFTCLLFISSCQGYFGSDRVYIDSIDSISERSSSSSADKCNSTSQGANYWQSKKYCQCVVGYSDDLFCEYDCTCNVQTLKPYCEASLCKPTWRTILFAVAGSLCVLMIGAGCIGLCYYLLVCRKRNPPKDYSLVPLNYET